MFLPFLFRRGFSTTARRCRPSDNVLPNLETSAKKVKPALGQTSTIIDKSSPEPPPVFLIRDSYKTKEKPVRYVSDNKFHLPLDHDWSRAFPAAGIIVKHHACLRNAEVAAQVAEAFVPSGTRDKVIVEAFPGPGVLTRALLNLPKERIRKIIVLESHEQFLDFLRPLQEVDPRVQVLPWHAYDWNTYHKLEVGGYLNDVPVSSWQDSDPQLQFIAHLPTSVFGEQLIAQLVRLIPDQSWLFRYGRIPMHYVMLDRVWERLTANTHDRKNRCKLSVIAEAVTSFQEVLPQHQLQPYEKHFWPPSLAADSRTKGKPIGMVAVRLNPLLEQKIEKDMMSKWDYCLRKLFVLKSNTIKRAIPYLAPGASSLLTALEDKSLPHRVDITKKVSEMEVEDWATLVRVLDEWPFAPEDLHVSDTFSRDDVL
ncbi:S-adenosyl-L-methionine-dependent methyltransferase [Melanogaster broomeanus]|nr:S-adenosyl-L-methionine-dependent methyltransferase [Melanogaster broomeanus]